MSDLILYIVKQLVTNPDAVKVDEQNNGGEVSLILTVAPEDMGLIIGKSGQTIKALRKILIIKAMADNVRVNLQLAEPEGGRSEKSVDQPSDESEKPKKTKKTEKPILPAEDNDQADKTQTPIHKIDPAETPLPADNPDVPEEIAEKHADEVAEQD